MLRRHCVGDERLGPRRRLGQPGGVVAARLGRRPPRQLLAGRVIDRDSPLLLRPAPLGQARRPFFVRKIAEASRRLIREPAQLVFDPKRIFGAGRANQRQDAAGGQGGGQGAPRPAGGVIQGRGQGAGRLGEAPGDEVRRVAVRCRNGLSEMECDQGSEQ